MMGKMLKEPYAKLIAGIILLMIFSGCAGWKTITPVESPPAPEKFHQAITIGQYNDDPWWEVFADSVLNDLMVEAFRDNLTLEQTAARLEQFRAMMQMSRASWFPGVNASASILEVDSFEDRSPNAPFNMSQFQQKYSLGLNAAYEVDIWGKLKAGRSASYADYLAGEEDLRSVVIMISGYVAKTYFTVLELKMQKGLLDKTIDSYSANFEMISERYRRGLVSSQDLYQAEAALEGAKSQLSQIESGLAKTEHALCILLGKYPEAGKISVSSEIPVATAAALPGLPSELLRRRPDVRAAMRRLEAADYRAAEAVAQLYPSFSLSANVSGSGNDLSTALDPENIFWTAIGNVAIPLFQGGRLHANAERAEQAWKAETANYKSVMLNAFREVEDALVSEKTLSDYIRHLRIQVEAADNTLRLAEERYLRGVTDYLPVTFSQTSYFNARRNLISGMRSLVEARVNLMTAIGGGWTDEAIEKYVYGK